MATILRFEAENFKRLRAVAIAPNGAPTVLLRGRNEQGKSSILDGIYALLGGERALPPKPVREGADEANLYLDLGDLHVTRRITADGKTSLKVLAADGTKLSSPQTLLNQLFAGLSFDPMAFTRMDKPKRDETLRKLVGIDFIELNAKRQKLYDERTLVGREKRRLDGELSGVPVHDDAPAEEVSVAALAQKLSEAEALRGKYRELKNSAMRGRVEAKHAQDTAASKREEAARLIREAEQLEASAERRIREADAADAEANQLDATIPDTADIRRQLEEADAINAKVRDNARHADIARRIAEQQARYQELSAQIDAIDIEKARQLEEANYPLPNMRLTEEGVTLNGLPFEQASSAVQLRASVAMGMALNPTLRVLLVREGSFLDEDSLRVLSEMAEEHGYQVWIEQVSNERRGPGILIEDGTVVYDTEAAE